MDQETAERIATALEAIAEKMNNLFYDDDPIDKISKKLEEVEETLSGINLSIQTKN